MLNYELCVLCEMCELCLKLWTKANLLHQLKSQRSPLEGAALLCFFCAVHPTIVCKAARTLRVPAQLTCLRTSAQPFPLPQDHLANQQGQY